MRVREVGAVLGPAALLALERGHHHGLGVVQHELELQRAEHVLVEDVALVVHRHGLRLLLEAAHDLEGGVQPLLVAEDGHVLVHRLAQLGLDLGHAPAGAVAAHDRLDGRLLLAAATRARAAEAAVPLTARAAWAPERRPNTSVSRSELAPRRLPPCTDTQAHSPAA